ncbi:hypothetical protein EJB05_54321, partial [Eragrostis curvula]
MALRRWKPFLGAFEHIDAAIESASVGITPRVEFKRARNQIVETLCGATDDAVAEEICRMLDDAMAESLVTLRAARAEQNPDMLASGELVTLRAARAEQNPDMLASGELVTAVGALARAHESARVRGLARSLEELATASAAMDMLDRVFPPTPEDTAAATGVSSSFSDNASPDLDAAAATTKKQQSAVPVKKQLRPATTPAPRLHLAAAEPLPQKKAPLVVVRGGGRVRSTSPNVQASSAKVPAAPQRPKKTTLCHAEDKKKMQATKRKLQERYQEADDAKRRRTIKVLVVAPEMPRQRTAVASPSQRSKAFSQGLGTSVACM